MEQHPLFKKYTRDWLHRVTGYSKGLLSRVATGKVPLNRSFVERVCYKLGLPEEELFLTQTKHVLPIVPKTQNCLKAIIEGMSIEKLRLILRFAEFLAKQRG
ncbi:hypothetical protein ES708_16626 [subsurface metagenome]